ncbi:acyltransferase family protein [Pontibacillus salicampi]|uniref:Acyltransferase family protein n=1 Tax=Pontibacillus salicampi TaxID=1449801 RepID=A0ABV6LSB4_9BACI
MMKEKIEEVYFIRAIACLCVVFIHSLTLTQSNYQLPATTVNVIFLTKLMIMFATPLFVMLSEFLLSYSYSNRIPKGFWKKRVSYIFIPFLFIALLYTIDTWFIKDWGMERFVEVYFNKAVLGLWHGYFVLIIFQFYVLHVLFVKYAHHFKATWLIIISFVINGAYLSFFNFFGPGDFPEIDLLWKYSKLPFLGWILYFTVAFYAGKHINVFKEGLQRYKHYIYVGVLANIALLLCVEKFDLIRLVSSKRPDLLLYTILIFSMLFLFAQKLRKIPSFFMIISKYSYSIYLLHLLVMYNLIRFLKDLPMYINMGVYTILLFIAGIGGSLLISYLLNLLPFGAFLVGKLKKSGAKDKRYDKQRTNEGYAPSSY